MVQKIRPSGWSIYWVASDGLEDCFVVARNSRSAARIECEMNGFDSDMLRIERILSVPRNVEIAFRVRAKRLGKDHTWPWYADNWLLSKLGARFREIDGLSETLLNDRVYSAGFFPRSIGAKAIRELDSIEEFSTYGEEDVYASRQMHLFTMLGICTARCQEIEHLIAQSFILGVAEAQKGRYKTISDLVRAWQKKTFGQLLRLIDEGYEVDPVVRASLDLFLEMRNKLIHGITTDPRYDIDTSWGQDETIAFLKLFEILSRPIRKAFRASFYASIDYGNEYLIKDPQAPKVPLSKKQLKEIGLFAAFFEPRIPGNDKGSHIKLPTNVN